jgi:ribosomal protein S6
LPSIPEDKLDDVVALIREVITKEGGTEIDAEAPIKQDLAYSMSKTVGSSRYVVNDAYIGWIKFEVEPAKILEIKTGVEKIKEVLRFLLVKASRETTFTFAKAKAKAEVKEPLADESDAVSSDSDQDVEQANVLD